MIPLLLTILLACVVFIVVSTLTHTFVLALIAAVLVLIVGVPINSGPRGPRWPR